MNFNFKSIIKFLVVLGSTAAAIGNAMAEYNKMEKRKIYRRYKRRLVNRNRIN